MQSGISIDICDFVFFHRAYSVLGSWFHLVLDTLLISNSSTLHSCCLKSWPPACIDCSRRHPFFPGIESHSKIINPHREVYTNLSLTASGTSFMAGSSTAADINIIASFLAHEQIPELSQASPTDCLVLCGSAILHCAETVFSALQTRPDLAKTLVICGGIGHSTQHLYDAIAQNPKYDILSRKIQGLSESRVLSMVFERFYDVASIVEAGCQIITEDKSTNCGANALETRKVLKVHNVPTPSSLIIVQDPTMSLRTLAAFRKTYEDMSTPPIFTACPTFVPEVQIASGKLAYAVTGVDSAGLWEMGRFCDLVVGEIPRLRDDVQGYGPKGKGFIEHVDIPGEVEEAWRELESVAAGGRARLAG